MVKNILYFILAIFVSICSYSQEGSNFIRLTNTFNGNSNIVEDHLGYIWVSSNEGLYKYNGYDFIHIPYQTIFGNDFAHDRSYRLFKDTHGNFWINSFSGELTKMKDDGSHISYKEKIGASEITVINAAKDNVWFGSANGVLYKHNLNTLTFEKAIILPEINNVSQYVSSIAFTGNDELWISTRNGHIYKYFITSKKLIEFKDPIFNVEQSIRLTNDKNGTLWIATEFTGLFSLNSNGNKELKQHNQSDISNSNTKFDMFVSLFCDRAGIIWAGTDGDGLYKINPINNKVQIFKHNTRNKFSIGDNTITYINEDTNGNMWILTKDGKINIIPNNKSNIKYNTGLVSSTPTKILSVLKSSNEGSLWIGTDGSGLNRVFPNNSKIQYDSSTKGSHSFEGKYIHSLLEDGNGNIWIATYQRGLWFYDIRSTSFSKIETTDALDKNSSDIRFLFNDSKNRIWATAHNAINVYSLNRKKIASFKYNSNGLFGTISQSIYEDENEAIWVGVNDGGLFKFHENMNDLNHSYFVMHDYYTKEKNDFLNYNIQSITSGNKGNLWILCSSGNLIKYNVQNNQFESFAKKETLKDLNISAVLIQNSKNLWLSSKNGIHHYNLMKDLVKSYYLTDGLQGNNFSKRSSFKDRDGIFYFGGKNGLNSFFPGEMNKKESLAKLYINTIEILNKPAHSIIGDQLETSIENVEKIKLNSNQSTFSFQFSAIDNILNPNYHYSYRLKGFNDEWITAKQSRIASYNNIPFGNYTFEVKAGSKKGEWNIQPKTIDIFIKAPWWFSTMAISFYIIFGLLLIYAIIVWLQLKNKLNKEEWQNQKDKELYALKMNFFAKMSHEIQTPLTLILGPIDDMIDRAEIKGNQLLKQRLSIINNNAKRLSRIATELMTVRSKELGRLRIFASQNNLKDHLNEIATSFKEQARFKNIDFNQQYSTQTETIWYDLDKIEHVIYNLLSNAFKFTPKDGAISLNVNENITNKEINISISDTGPGISKNELEDIFKLFYQSDLGKNKKGFGIGLALSKELVSLHHGKLNVTSSTENGTCFSVTLSVADTIFSENEKIIIESNDKLPKLSKSNFKSLEKDLRDRKISNKLKLHTILIIEDNVEMQIFLRDVLKDRYNLLISENGKEGILMTEKHKPDLIISDIMMPVMDGIEMCKKLQRKKSTAHIPIIFLTAKNSSKGKIVGLKSGAIEYINKPFNFHELILKVDNIIATQQKTILKYKTDIINTPAIAFEKSKDDLFMENLIAIINKELHNPDFKLEELSNILNMSYSVIYRKCHEITGKTLIELVRSLKLRKALFLIIKNRYNVSEAAYMVGYKDSKYFSKCFKEEFGKTPNSLKKESNKMDVSFFLKKYNLDFSDHPI